MHLKSFFLLPSWNVLPSSHSDAESDSKKSQKGKEANKEKNKNELNSHSPEIGRCANTKSDNDSDFEFSAITVQLDRILPKGEVNNVNTPSPTAGSALRTSTPVTSLSSKSLKLSSSSDSGAESDSKKSQKGKEANKEKNKD